MTLPTSNPKGSCSIPLAELVGGVSSVPLEDAKGNTKGMGMFGYEMALDGDSTSAGLAVEDGWSLHHERPDPNPNVDPNPGQP